jgi:hypothetical protein
MANYRAVANGNWGDGATWGGGAVPPNNEGHNIYSNNFTVTINVNVNVALITNGAVTASFVGGGTSAASGGGFTLSDGITVTATGVTTQTTASALYTFNANAPAVTNIVGNITGGNTNNAFGMRNNGTGTVNITGNCLAPGNSTNTVSNASTGTVNITGNCFGGTGGSGTCILNNVTGTVNITGNVTGGSAGNTHGVNNIGAGIVTIVGSVTGGAASNGAVNSSTGNLTITGDLFAAANIAVVSTGGGNLTVSGSFHHSSTGVPPYNATRIILGTTPLNARTRYALNGTGSFVDMFTADNSLGQAPVSDVRQGVVYASGNLTGTCAVPAAGSVALGVPVSNTTGTAVLTPAAVWNALTSGMTTSGSIGERLKNAATVHTTGQSLADALTPVP